MQAQLDFNNPRHEVRYATKRLLRSNLSFDMIVDSHKRKILDASDKRVWVC